MWTIKITDTLIYQRSYWKAILQIMILLCLMLTIIMIKYVCHQNLHNSRSSSSSSSTSSLNNLADNESVERENCPLTVEETLEQSGPQMRLVWCIPKRRLSGAGQRYPDVNGMSYNSALDEPFLADLDNKILHMKRITKLRDKICELRNVCIYSTGTHKTNNHSRMFV